MTGAPRIRVLCLGNPDRGDDGVGGAVAIELADRLPAGVELQTRSGDMLSLVDEWAGLDVLICVDAANGTSPGSVHRLDLTERELPRDLAFVSSHAFGLPEAVALARTLGIAPDRIVVYAVEGTHFTAGADLSPPVAKAAIRVAEEVCAEAERLQETTQNA